MSSKRPQTNQRAAAKKQRAKPLTLNKMKLRTRNVDIVKLPSFTKVKPKDRKHRTQLLRKQSVPLKSVPVTAPASQPMGIAQPLPAQAVDNLPLPMLTEGWVCVHCSWRNEFKLAICTMCNVGTQLQSIHAVQLSSATTSSKPSKPSNVATAPSSAPSRNETINELDDTIDLEAPDDVYMATVHAVTERGAGVGEDNSMDADEKHSDIELIDADLGGKAEKVEKEKAAWELIDLSTAVQLDRNHKSYSDEELDRICKGLQTMLNDPDTYGEACGGKKWNMQLKLITKSTRSWEALDKKIKVYVRDGKGKHAHSVLSGLKSQMDAKRTKEGASNSSVSVSLNFYFRLHS